MQHMLLSFSTRVRGGLSVHSLSENSGVAAYAATPLWYLALWFTAAAASRKPDT
jgi:hypothetical protein